MTSLGLLLWLAPVAPTHAADVYYSVGISTADLKSGAPSVTISSGTATFSAPQPNNVGVGDQVTYNGATIAFISGRTSSTVYAVITGTGAVPPDVAGATVNSIRRAFNDPDTATVNAADGAHLGSSDLVAAGHRLHLACYNDGPDASLSVRIEEPWLTGPSNYIRVFTPTDPSQVGVSQRHKGKAGTGYRIRPVGPAGNPFINFIFVSTDNGYVRIEGIEIDGSGLTLGENLRGIFVNESLVSQDVRISHGLVYGLVNTAVAASSKVRGIYVDQSQNSFARFISGPGHG